MLSHPAFCICVLWPQPLQSPVANILRALIFASAVLTGTVLLLAGIRIKAGPLGKPPIPWPAMLLAKVSMAVSIGLMLWKAGAGSARLSAPSSSLFLILLLAGTTFLAFAILRLGHSLRVGLPSEETALVVSGIYRFSRNPIYLGVYCLAAASLIYAFSWLNVIAAITCVFLHHRIVLSEEKFLSARFPDYELYRKRVRRYL